jgi:hypothetical protein
MAKKNMGFDFLTHCSVKGYCNYGGVPPVELYTHVNALEKLKACFFASESLANIISG